jgi:hypothetical protein
MNRAEEQKAHRARVEKSLESIKEDMLNMKLDMGQVKVDLSHHIKRSDKHERILMTMIVAGSLAGGAGVKFLLPYLMKLI